MTRWYTETFAALTDVISVPTLAFLSFLVTMLVALGWYFWPSWLPWNWKLRRGRAGGSKSRTRGEGRRGFRLGRLRWRLRWRRRGSKPPAEERNEELDPDALPDLPAAVLVLSADQLAEAGRYAEAVRERLRVIVRDLIQRGLIPPSPGWTVTELARHATLTVPTLTTPLVEAVEIFSRIWYGLVPATAADDTAMRTHSAAVAGTLAGVATPVRSGS
jgi:hypothetical protein